MTQYYALVSMDLKSARKNERSVIILDPLKDFDSGILVLEKWLDVVKVIPSAIRYYHEILSKARKTELTLDELLARPVKKRTICVISEGKIRIVEEDAFNLYERAIERSFSLCVELEVSENQLKTRRCIKYVRKPVKNKKVHTECQGKRWKNRVDAFKPRPVDWNSNKDLVIKPVSEPYFIIQHMMNNDEDSLQKLYPLQFCIENLVQPDGMNITDVSSGGTGSRQPTVSQSVPNSHSNSDRYTQLENSSEHTRQMNSPTSHNSLQISVSSDSGPYVQVVSTNNLNTDVRVQVASTGNERNSNASELHEGFNTEIIQQPQHPLLQDYIKRVASYATWHQFASFDTAALALAGFYYTGEGITVRCFFCGTEIANLSSHDDPMLEHLRKSNSCGYLRRELEPRRIAEYQERFRNENGVSQQANGAVQGGSRVTSRNPGAWSESDHIRSPQYQAYSIRLSSFARWPSDIRQRPEQVADSGFYYTGLQDIVRCFACDGGLKNWDPEDEPWIEHARWFPQCPFVKRVKGQEFIDHVRRMTEDSDEEEDAVVHSTFQPNNPMADTPSLRNELNPHLDQANAENVLETDAAKCVLEAGYSKDTVARTINELLTKGKVDYTSTDIMEIILEKEDRAEIATEAHGDMNLPPTPGPNTQRNDSVQSLIEENERLRQSMLCVNCRAANRNILLLPCTHLCLCSNCADKAAICPLCYKKIRERIKTYVI